MCLRRDFVKVEVFHLAASLSEKSETVVSYTVLKIDQDVTLLQNIYKSSEIFSTRLYIPYTRLLI